MVTIGAQKSGTTALYAYLGQHEHFVAGADGKEVQFFSSLARWNAGPHRYMEAFPVMERDDAERAVVADMSPAYMTDFGTLQSMSELLPGARIVVMLREPVERAWSEISMLRRQQRTQIEKDQFLLKHASELRACAEQMADGVAGLIGKVKEDEARKYECASPASADKDLARVFQRTWRALRRKVVKLGMEAVFVRGAGVSDLTSQIRLTTDDELYDELVSEIAAIEACMASGDVTLKACFDEQLVPLNNLAKANVFRGMYAAQLANVYELFAREQVLVIEDRELREEPMVTLGKVCAHVGLDSSFKFEALDSQHMSERVDEAMPGFRFMSGWRADGGQDAERIPDKVEQLLRDFYATHNAALFELLGREFAW
jgi:hypothetical protein